MGWLYPSLLPVKCKSRFSKSVMGLAFQAEVILTVVLDANPRGV